MPQRLDFKAIAEKVDIFEVAQHLGLTIVKDRAHCPVCDSDRALQFFAETNSFQCHASGNTRNSDCIALYAHVKGYEGMYRAAKELSELFADATAPRRTAQATAPQKPEGATSSTSAAAPAQTKGPGPFDPDAYAAKLAYTDEVKALGIAQSDAERLGIGFMNAGLHRGRVVFTVRNPDGSIAGFVGVQGSDLKLPGKWIAATVVPLKRRA